MGHGINQDRGHMAAFVGLRIPGSSRDAVELEFRSCFLHPCWQLVLFPVSFVLAVADVSKTYP